MDHRHPANQAIHDGQGRTGRAVDRFVTFFGSLKFIAWMTVMIICWITLNTLALTGAIHFDKFPFILLNLLFSTQASYAAPLILLSQNRQSEHDRISAEHDYRTNETALAEIRSNTALTDEVRNLTAAVHEAICRPAGATAPAPRTKARKPAGKDTP